ncbi:MAG: hypothetical protein ACQESX_06390 [Bacteroidota bacterium]
MKNIAHDLFLLMFSLTQVQNKAKLHEMFVEGLNEIFSPVVFQFSKESKEEFPYELEIKTRRSHFGFIRITDVKNAPKEHLPMLQNATQMLAVMLERITFDQQLEKERESLEQIADRRNKDLKKKINELEQVRNASLNLVEDLQLEVEKRKQYEKELKESETELRHLKENLEAEVDKKTKELNERVEILERFQNATVEREFRIKELKEEVERLKNSQSNE